MTVFDEPMLGQSALGPLLPSCPSICHRRRVLPQTYGSRVGATENEPQGHGRNRRRPGSVKSVLSENKMDAASRRLLLMSFKGIGKSIQMIRAPTQRRRPAHHPDEFPAGYSLAGCSPALPASASPAGVDSAASFCPTLGNVSYEEPMKRIALKIKTV